ncbi:MAG: hypothetical protein Kow0049_17930 [Stanieria sp.]
MKTSTFGILATVALTFSPLAAFAQETQVIRQNASNSAIAVGSGNHIRQDVNQNSVQNQFDFDGYANSPSTQTSIQGASNSAAAIGQNNNITQGVNQNSVQNSGDDYSQYFKY